MTYRTTVVGVFDDQREAQKAINELKRAGFADDEIGVTMRESGTLEHGATREMDDEEGGTHAAEGATAGLAAGAGLGALWGLGIVTIGLPAIGPAIAGGALAAVLTSALAGAAAAGLAGALIGLGIPEEEAEYYESEFKAGRTIVTVKTARRQNEATVIMRRHSGYDMSSRQDSSGESYAAKSPMAAQPSGSVLRNEGAGARGQTVQAREEELHARKERREGEVRVRKEVHTEHKTLDVPVEREEVVVERHPVSGQRATGGSIGRSEEIRVPVSEEHVHVEKTPVVKEEVTIGKQKVRGTERVEGDVRKEEIKVEGDATVKGRERKA